MPTPTRRRPKPPLSPDSIVRACGPVPSHLYVLGERAGEEEHNRGVPFVGRAGRTLREWFDCAKLDLDNFRRWNVCIDYKPHNPKPRGSEIERDRLAVETDIVCCQPKVIVAVGLHAMRWCLKDVRRDLGSAHGREFDVQIHAAHQGTHRSQRQKKAVPRIMDSDNPRKLGETGFSNEEGEEKICSLALLVPPRAFRISPLSIRFVADNARDSIRSNGQI